jgi:hypothetical protein
MKKNIIVITKRKRDFVSLLAVFLFITTVGFELFVIYWIPATLNSRGHWKRDVALEETIEKLDTLRSYMTSLATNRKDIAKDEIAMAKRCLDDYAIYLRGNRDTLGNEQIDELYLRLLEFEQSYLFWKSGRAYSKECDIDSSCFMRLQFRSL